MATRLEVRGLTVKLPTRAGWIRPVNDVSFSLGEGETLGIVGESGSGKTMLAAADKHGCSHAREVAKGKTSLLPRPPKCAHCVATKSP